MAGQIARTTTGMSVTSGASALQSRITTLKNKMKLNQPITAADFNELLSIYNRWITHRHYALDLWGIDTFGDSPIYGSGISTWNASSTVIGSSSNGNTVAASNLIDDLKVNSIIASVNTIRSHYHTITDNKLPDPADAVP